MENKKAGIRLGLPVATTGRLPENMALVRIIRQHRQRLGLSLNQLAQRTKDHKDHPQVSRQMLGFFEADEYLIGPDALGFVARALRTSPRRSLFCSAGVDFPSRGARCPFSAIARRTKAQCAFKVKPGVPIQNDLGSAWLVPPADCTRTGHPPRDGRTTITPDDFKNGQSAHRLGI
jgi:transcriptional regulator with XRE-family HTH domain